MELPTFTPTFAKHDWMDVPQLLLVALYAPPEEFRHCARAASCADDKPSTVPPPLRKVCCRAAYALADGYVLSHPPGPNE